MEINYTDVYKEIDFISRELRKAIKHMPRYNRYNEGDRIINILLDVKIAVKLACKGRNYSLDSNKLYIQECSRGVTFVGAIIKQNRIYCGGRAICKMYNKVSSRYSHYNENKMDDFISSVNSYLGLMRHYKSYKVRKKFVLNNMDEWMPHIVIGKGYQKINKVA